MLLRDGLTGRDIQTLEEKQVQLQKCIQKMNSLVR